MDMPILTYKAEVHETPDEDLEVFENVANISHGDFALCRRSSLILAQARFDIGSFVLAEPFRIFWKIGDYEEEGEGDDTGQSAFKDEDPSPSIVTAHAAHFTNGTGE